MKLVSKNVYLPMLDHRAALLLPLAKTKTLGSWDIKCTVNGGGSTGKTPQRSLLRL